MKNTKQPKIVKQLSPWHGKDKGKKGEPVPVQSGEVAVIDLAWITPMQHQLTLSDSRVVTVGYLEMVGWDYNLKAGAVFCLANSQARNAVPRVQREAWTKAHAAWSLEVEKRQREMNSVHVPINTNGGIDKPLRVAQYTSVSVSVSNDKSRERDQMSMKPLKVKRELAVALFVSLDYQTAGKWSDKKLLEKIQGLPKMVDEETTVDDEDQEKLLKAIVHAVEAERGIELAGGAAEEEEAPKAKGKKGKSAPVEEEAEEEAEAPKAKGKKDAKPAAPAKGAKSAPKPPGKRGVGVVATIIEEFRKGTAKKPKTVDEVHAVLVQKFPDRDPKGMRSTTSAARSWMRTEKGLKVMSNEKGIWIED